MKPCKIKKKVVIIGGGPAGMQAAIVASQTGHHVSLLEKKNNLGGQFRFAHQAPRKGEVAELLRYLNYMLSKSEVKVTLNKQAGVHEVLAETPDTVILATGSRSRMPEIPGANLPFVHDVRKIYETMPALGRHIIILGGGDIGCETADMLAADDRDITIIEILPYVLSRMKDIPKEDLLKRLKDKNVRMFTETEVVSIEPEKITIRDRDGNNIFLLADSVIISIGTIPENSLFQQLKEKVTEVYAIGDAGCSGNVGDALRSAVKIALEI